jgi:aromatic-amino-acid transaminase
MSLFTAVEMAPRDPILGLNEQFNADTNPPKVNLGVGVYYDDNGKLPLLSACRRPKKQMMAAPRRAATCPSTASPPMTRPSRPGIWRRQRARQERPRRHRAGLGGTGGLKVGADFLKKLNPDAKVLISDPSWENHRALFTRPASTSKATPTTTPPSAASTSTACWPR